MPWGPSGSLEVTEEAISEKANVLWLFGITEALTILNESVAGLVIVVKTISVFGLTLKGYFLFEQHLRGIY